MHPLLYTSAVVTVIAIRAATKFNLLGKFLKADGKAKEDPVPVTELEWKWSCYDHFEDQYGRTELKKRTAESVDEDDEKGPFHVIYRSRANQLWPDAVQVVLSSAPLIKIVRNYLPDNGDLQSLSEPTINGRELFLVLDMLKNHKIGDGNGAGIKPAQGEVHLKHLVRFMEKEYDSVIVRVQRMAEEKRVSWDLLWAFLPHGKKVVYSCDHSEVPLCAVVSTNYYFYNEYPPGWLFLLDLDVWDYDGLSYHKCQIQRQISRFEGERCFASVAVRPMEMIGVPHILEEEFLSNGKRFYELEVDNTHRFMHYTGPMFQKRKVGNCWQLFKENADGRVMIDLTSFSSMNPAYPMGNARLPTSSSFWIDQGDGREFEFEAPREVTKLSEDTDVSHASLILSPHIVYGFSFTLKQWGSFSVSGFREISFNTNAFNNLVMEPQVKGLVYNLVSEYIATSVDGAPKLQRVDPISNKGEGCIFLCYGPPGTGKTLTAESVAENMRRPLWALSVTELGTTPADLEKTLLKVLDIAATWQAVLLLDEADIYLEKRTSVADISRNAMTGVFLRLLEYYRGVLFLTTNRVGTVDDAFRSRISMFLSYKKLSVQHREQIWRYLLERVGAKSVNADFVAEMAPQDLNGREIRNAIHTAQTWAKSNGEDLEPHHVRYVVNLLVTALDTLKEEIVDSSHLPNGSLSYAY